MISDIKNLCNTVDSEAFHLGVKKPEIPSYILDNLKGDFFEWQQEAFKKFLTYQEVKKRNDPDSYTHLMFNMATGSGKTMLMAAVILYYYEQGYRHFLFFVNQNNILDKTMSNFINSAHTKYLYKNKIIIDNATISIKNVEIFSDNPQGIEIKLTTIQQLYNDIHIEKENQTTLDDLHKKDIIMLADEAHHLNANTKNIDITKDFFDEGLKGSKDEKEKKGWEYTVIELILKKNSGNKKSPENNGNVLLEFTATIPSHSEVINKYSDKIIYEFGLVDFLKKGFTKEINLISSTLDKKERILHALLFHWYRHEIAIKYGIVNFKPVILFRSKEIKDSKKDYEYFLNWVNHIQKNDFYFINNISDKIHEDRSTDFSTIEKSRTEKVLEFIKNENISYSKIAAWLKKNFTGRNVIITNSKTNKNKKEEITAEQEKILNSLEDKGNNIRAIFTVNRLTEGWDVLNLFDIVRLYKGQNSGGSSKTPPAATTSEKQLIGRGVRYFPFTYNDKPQNQRKFDSELEHELRVLEELHYYTYDEKSRYISHLKEELRKEGYIRDDRVVRTYELKESFKQSEFYNKTKLFYNKKVPNPNRKKKKLDDIPKDFLAPYRIKGLEMVEEIMDYNFQESLQKLNLKEKGFITIKKKFRDIEKHIFLKAINIKAKQVNSLFQFEKLCEELDINSIDDLQTKMLSDFQITIVAPQGTKYEYIDGKEKLNIVLIILRQIFGELKKQIAPEIGSDFISRDLKYFFSKPKSKLIAESIETKNLENELKQADWYALNAFTGTAEEKGMIEFIQDTIGKLDQECDEFYLLRNEEVYKIYDFKTAKGFCPDFILFLKSKNKGKFIHDKTITKSEKYYQIFIEPKGELFIGYDNSIEGDSVDKRTFKTGKEGWKEEFLEEISKRYGISNIIEAENPKYSLIGLPFFSTKFKGQFEERFDDIIQDLSIFNNSP